MPHARACLVAAAQDAKTQYDVIDWVGDSTFTWYAFWWVGYQRLQPGSASGSQAQEAWHRELKAHVGSLRKTIPDFCKALEIYCGFVLDQLSLTTDSFPDLPYEPFPDDLLLNADRMEDLERTSAPEFLQDGCMSEWKAADGALYFAMRPRLHGWNALEQVWEKALGPRKVQAKAAQHMASFIEARTAAAISSSLVSLGAHEPFGANMDNLRVAVSRHVVAVFGPAAARYWRQPSATSTDTSPYGQALCGFCDEAALHCTCEHIHAGLLRQGILCSRVARTPGWSPANNSSRASQH
jgi:hypothetical protein